MGHVNGNDGFRKQGCWVFFLVAGQVYVTFSRVEFAHTMLVHLGEKKLWVLLAQLLMRLLLQYIELTSKKMRWRIAITGSGQVEDPSTTPLRPWVSNSRNAPNLYVEKFRLLYFGQCETSLVTLPFAMLDFPWSFWARNLLEFEIWEYTAMSST